jgi:hypothetical protein
MLHSGVARWTWVLFAVLLPAASRSATGAARAAPPPPKQYDVAIRYRIDAGRTDRLAQFDEMLRYLGAAGFKAEPGQEEDALDPYATRLQGTIASADVRKLLREPHVQALLLKPAGSALPEDPAAPVKVQLELADGFPPDRQRLLADEIRPKLAQLGFQEAVGYDSRGHTRMVGTIPAGELHTLLKDLRWQPSGWLAPAVPVAELPAPLRYVSPIRVTEVTPEPAGVPPAKSIPAAPESAGGPLDKVSAGLRALADAAQPERMEVILSFTPTPEDPDWRRVLTEAAPGLTIEGRLGPVVTVLGPPRLAAALAELSAVSVVRRLRPAWTPLKPIQNLPPDNREALRASGLDRLHARGYRGRGVRVAVIAGDFRGYERLKGKQLPAGLSYVDLTAARNPTLLPDPFAGDANTIGPGTQEALAATLAAPEAELTLLRIDPAAPYQVEEAARLIAGEVFRSDSLDRRRLELEADAERLRLVRDDLLQERKTLFGEFGVTEEVSKRRQEYFRRLEELSRQQKALQERRARFLDLLTARSRLRGIQVVSCSLTWDSGYPVGGGRTLSRYFDDHPHCTALWFQAAGDTNGQAWAGPYRDVDGNAVMEFAPPDTPLRPERWTAELNFLAWRPFGKERTPDLPNGAKLRLSVQWREVHDPEAFQSGGDPYFRPLADLKLVILRQRDPTGTRLPADDLDVVARSVGLPQRLDNEPTSATYEQTVEFTVTPAGRYAVRVEGLKPAGTWPAAVPALPGLQREWELWPRLFVEVLDDPSRSAGRAVFLDYVTDRGTLGIPADARGVTTVGAADLKGRPEPSSAKGPPLNRDLLVKPDVLAFDVLRFGLEGGTAAYGTSQATPFAAGLAAAVLSAGTPRHRLEDCLRATPGVLLWVR